MPYAPMSTQRMPAVTAMLVHALSTAKNSEGTVAAGAMPWFCDQTIPAKDDDAEDDRHPVHPAE